MKKSKLLSFALIMMSFSLMAQTYDMVIKGGHLIDPINKIDQIMDVAISGNKIAAVEKKSTGQAKNSGCLRAYSKPWTYRYAYP